MHGIIGVSSEFRGTRAKLPDGSGIRQPSAEYLDAAAARAERALIARAQPQPEAVPATVPAEGEPEEPEPLIVEEPKAPETKVKRGKVASKRLKKVAKEVKALGVDADVEPSGGDDA